MAKKAEIKISEADLARAIVVFSKEIGEAPERSYTAEAVLEDAMTTLALSLGARLTSIGGRVQRTVERAYLEVLDEYIILVDGRHLFPSAKSTPQRRRLCLEYAAIKMGLPSSEYRELIKLWNTQTTFGRLIGLKPVKLAGREVY